MTTSFANASDDSRRRVGDWLLPVALALVCLIAPAFATDDTTFFNYLNSVQQPQPFYFYNGAAGIRTHKPPNLIAIGCSAIDRPRQRARTRAPGHSCSGAAVLTAEGADGAEFSRATLPTSEQWIHAVEARRATAARYDASSLSYAHTRSREFATAHDIPVIALRDALTANCAQRGNLFGGYTAAEPAGTGHSNETRNRAAAQIVAQALCSQSRAITGG